MVKIKDMSIREKAEYICGKKFLGTSTREVTNEDMYQSFCTMLHKYDDVLYVFNYLESYTEFFKCCTDFAKWFPKKHWKELFYAVKNGFYSTDVPSDSIYLTKKAYTAISIPNLILKQIPVSWQSSWFEEGYFSGGYTLRDVICTFCMPTYRPLDHINNKVTYETFTEIYIKDTDMVAAVPNRIGDLLSAETIDRIKCEPNGLSVDGKFLRTLGGYHGAANSIYDLRQLY